MKAAVLVEPGCILLEEKTMWRVGPTDALMHITAICWTYVHNLKGKGWQVADAAIHGGYRLRPYRSKIFRYCVLNIAVTP